MLVTPQDAAKIVGVIKYIINVIPWMEGAMDSDSEHISTNT